MGMTRRPWRRMTAIGSWPLWSLLPGLRAYVLMIDAAALAVPHPVTPSAASSTAPAMPRTAVSLRMPPRYS